jgi:hypothetical protein
VFLVDATLLAAEVVTADARVGTGVAVVLAALAAVKLAWVRQSAPALLSRRAAVLLGAHAAFVLALPAVSAHLAGARIFGPLSLLALWWTTLALPFARRALRDATLPDGQDAASPWHAAWTWGPAAMALLHLWAVGYIHSIDFQPAFLAPFLLGLAVTSRADQLAGQVVASAGAVLVSVGQEEALRWHLLGADALLVSPFRLALLGVAVAWCYLAWRDRARWLAVLGAGCAVAGLVGPAVSSGSSLLGRVLRWLGSALPSDAFEWGATTVVAAFVLLVAGARRSLAGAPGRPRGRRRESTPGGGLRGREWAALSLSLVTLAVATTASAPASSSGVAALLSLGAAGLAFVVGLVAMRRSVYQDGDPAGRRLGALAVVASVFVGMLAVSFPSREPHHSERSPKARQGEAPAPSPGPREVEPDRTPHERFRALTL